MLVLKKVYDAIEYNDVACRVDPVVGESVGMILHFVHPFARRDLGLKARQVTAWHLQVAGLAWLGDERLAPQLPDANDVVVIFAR